MKSIRPPLVAIFFMTYFYRTGGGCMAPSAPPWIRYYVSLKSANSVTKIFVKRLNPATYCVRDQHATRAPGRHVRDRIFKLTPIHASVIYHIP